MATGRIEVQATKVNVLNAAKTTPIIIADDTDASEDVRLKYRYLDLRRPVMFNTFKMRHDVTKQFVTSRHRRVPRSGNTNFNEEHARRSS